MNITLSKDADKLICTMYKTYLERRKAGATKVNAKSFGGADRVQTEIMPEWSIADVEDTCRELDRLNLLNCMKADNTIYIARLSDYGIAYMESRFKNGLTDVISHISSAFGALSTSVQLVQSVAGAAQGVAEIIHKTG